MEKSFIYRNRIALGGVVLLLSACAPLRGFLPSHETGAASRAVLAAQGQGLLGADANALSAAGRKQAMAAEYQALEYKKAGETVQWADAGSAASGSVTPGQPYRVGAQNCRQYSHNWVINSVPHLMRGSACRNEDGSWTPLI